MEASLAFGESRTQLYGRKRKRTKQARRANLSELELREAAAGSRATFHNFRLLRTRFQFQ